MEKEKVKVRISAEEHIQYHQTVRIPKKVYHALKKLYEKDPDSASEGIAEYIDRDDIYDILSTDVSHFEIDSDEP